MTLDEVRKGFSHKDPALVRLLVQLSEVLCVHGLVPARSRTRSGAPGDTVNFHFEGMGNNLCCIQFYPDPFLHFAWFRPAIVDFKIEAQVKDVLLNEVLPLLSPGRLPNETAVSLRVELYPADERHVRQISRAIVPLLEQASRHRPSGRKPTDGPRGQRRRDMTERKSPSSPAPRRSVPPTASPEEPGSGSGHGGLHQRVASLEEKLDRLSDQLALALQYVRPDPGSSLTKSRLVLEKCVLAAYRAETGGSPKRADLGGMLTDKNFVGKVQRRMISRMNSIRDMANLGPHGEPVDQKDAERVLGDLCDVLEWYFENYAHPLDS